VEWLPKNTLWIPVMLADHLIKANVVKEGDLFVGFLARRAALSEVSGGAWHGTDYHHLSSKNAFVQGHDDIIN
jgi:hypothetical protein